MKVYLRANEATATNVNLHFSTIQLVHPGLHLQQNTEPNL